MDFSFLSKISDTDKITDIHTLLTLCDSEFVPQLSSRRSTTQTQLISLNDTTTGIMNYLYQIISQSSLVVLEHNKIVAFMSFKNNYMCSHISKDFIPNIYITTVIVHPSYRKKGIARKMYMTLTKRFSKQYIFTRTWSSNFSHIRILLSLGFQEHCRLPEDRGPNIDTYYFRFISEP